MAIRLIASDLDGTLFGPDHVPEPRTVDAVNAAVDAGVIFAAVTGRSYFGGAELVTKTGATAHWFIGSNGGHRLNMETKVLEERLLFTDAQLAALMSELPRQLDGLGFGFEHAAGFTFDDGFRTVFPTAFDGGPREDTTGFSARDVGKVFVAHPDIGSDELIRRTGELVDDGTHVSTSGGPFVELTPQGATKGLALARLCRILGIESSEVVAFGDNNNDLSMLEWAGRGIAMANATPDAMAAADEVTASNLEFGVAAVIESLL